MLNLHNYEDEGFSIESEGKKISERKIYEEQERKEKVESIAECKIRLKMVESERERGGGRREKWNPRNTGKRIKIKKGILRQ